MTASAITCISLVLVLSSLAAAVGQEASAAGPAAVIVVRTDRVDATYHRGVSAAFGVSAQEAGKPVTEGEFGYRLSLDGATTLREGRGTLGEQPATVTGTLKEPGILRCDVTWEHGGKTHRAAAAAAFDPEKIEPTAVEAPDFMRFWELRKRELAKVPLDLRIERLEKYCDAAADVFKFSLGNINGSRVYGMMATPTKQGKYPAILALPWGGVYGIGDGFVKEFARQGYLAIEFGGHDHDIDHPAEWYQKEYAGPLAGYQLINAESPYRFYLLRVVLSCLRVIDWTVTRPEWDGRHLILTGSSQAAGLCVVTAGLDKRVTAIAATVPVLFEHTGRAHGRPSGWPGLYGDPRRVRTGLYYEGVSFARHITCPVLMGVGLVDTLCWPTTVYSGYNVIKAPKRLIVGPTSGHESIEAFYAAREPWLKEQAGKPK